MKRNNLSGRRGHGKALFLPMSRSAADGLVLPVRIAFEALRSGYAKRGAVVCLAEIVLLTGFLAESGHSNVEHRVLDNMEKHLLAALKSPAGDAIRFEQNVVDELMTIVNEYDRLLRESRLVAVVEANERLTRLSAATLAAPQP